MISLEKWKILTPLQNVPRNVGDLGKLIASKGFKSCPKSKKSPNLVILVSNLDHESPREELLMKYHKDLFLNWPYQASFYFILGLFKQTILVYNNFLWKNVFGVSSAGFRTHNTLIMSRLL